MSSSLQHMQRELAHDPGALDRLVRERGVPIIDDTTATFVFRGHADSVQLRHFIFGLETAQPFHRLPGTDLWFCVMELPEQSRIEYKIEVSINGHSQLIRDPLNPLMARDPYGANSVCQTRGYEAPQWAEEDPEARPGTLQPLHVGTGAFDESRSVTVYEPPRFRTTRRYPLLIVHDGEEFVEYARLKTVLDNLIYRHEIPPMVVALTQSPDRLREYADDERHASFIVNDLIPALDSKYPLYEGAAHRGLMGASFGAVATFATAARYPNAFGQLLLLSGSFAFSDIGDDHGRSPVFDPVASFMNDYRSAPRRLAERVFVACGVYESLIYENRSLVPLLQRTTMDVRYEEARDGHNWENWRDRLRSGLAWLFPGPLWMVYE